MFEEQSINGQVLAKTESQLAILILKWSLLLLYNNCLPFCRVPQGLLWFNKDNHSFTLTHYYFSGWLRRWCDCRDCCRLLCYCWLYHFNCGVSFVPQKERKTPGRWAIFVHHLIGILPLPKCNHAVGLNYRCVISSNGTSYVSQACSMWNSRPLDVLITL